MSKFKKPALLMLMALLILMIIPMSFASDAVDVGIDDSSDIIQNDNSDLLTASNSELDVESSAIEVDEKQSTTVNDTLGEGAVYETTPSLSSVEYTVGESSVVNVTASYVSTDEDYWAGLDLSGSSMYVYVNGTGKELSSVDSDAKSFSVDLKDIDYEFVAGETYSLVFHAPNGILSYANVDLSDCQFNPLTVTVKAASTPEPEYLYVSTPSPSSVEYTKGESCNVTFVLEYPDDYDLDEVPIEIFFDGSFFGKELEDVDNYAKSVTIDLADFDDMFEAGKNHTVIVRHVNDIMDYNDIGAADRLLNALTVAVKAAEVPTSDIVYESTPSPASVDYVIGESSNVTVSVVYPEAYAEDLEWYSMFVYINGEEVADRVAVSGVTADATSFVFDLKEISDKLVVGVNNLTFHPNPGSLEGTVSGDYVYNTLTVNASEAVEPQPEYLYVSSPSVGNVTVVEGESLNVTFTIEYDGLNFDDVDIAVFIDGSNWKSGVVDADPYNKTVTIDLADYADDLTVGNHTIVVRHTNDMYDTNWDELGPMDCQFNALNVIVKAAEVVEKLNTTMTVEAFANRDGSADVYIDFEDYVNGTVTLYMNDTEFDSQDVEDDFFAQFHIDHLDKGNYTFKVVFTSEEYTSLEGNDSISVDYGFMYFYLAEEEVFVGENFTALITLPDDANGTVVVTIGKNNYSINVTGGLMQVPIPALEEGSFTVYCNYTGDEKYYARVSDAQLVVKAAEPVVEYSNYTTTPSESTVNYVIGDNNVITVTINYNDTYADALVEVPVYVFINNAQEIAISSINANATSFNFDLKTISDYLTVGKNTVSFGPKLSDLSEIANFTLVLNNLTVNAENAPVSHNTTYVTTPTPSVVYYTLNESSKITVTVVYDDYFNDDLSIYTMFVYINGEEIADRVAIDGVKGNATTFEFDLKVISDKLVEGQNNLTFHPHVGALEGTFVGPYTFNNLTVNVETAPEPIVPVDNYTGIIYVDVSGKDTNDGSSSSPVATISKAIELASADNNTEHKIVIREGTYKENNLNITSALDIAGEGDVVIDAEKLNRILNINTTADVNISGITFKNGKASSAGAINIKDAKTTIDNCVFSENEASSGAAIVIDADNVKLTNDVFTNNTGRNGAVKVGVYSWSARKSSGSNSVIENCTFDNNHNSIYGNCIGLDIEEGTTGVKIIGSNFTNNKGEVYSEHGALYIKGDDVVVDNCLFENNTMGMAAAVQIDGENAVIKNSKFINNTVNTGLVTRSGAIEVQNAATITENTFINNGGDDCVQGGAIDIVYAEYGGDIVISDNEFINNSAAKGAAIYVDGGSEDGCEFDSLTIENNTFDGNEAQQGAGIYTATSTTPVDIKNNEFTKNTADEGSAIFVDNTFINLESNTMDDEEIYLDGYSEIDSETILTFDAPSQAVKDETVNVTARLTDDMNNSVSGVLVKFTANGKDIGEATTENGVATVEFTLDDAIEYLISGESDLDATIKTATINGILNATIDIPDVSGVAGDKITVPIVVKVDGENVTDGNVSVIFNNETIEVPINNGTANIELTLPKQAGNYDLIVSYGGNNETKVVNVSEAPVKLASVFSITLVSGYNVSAVLIDAYGNTIPYATVDYMVGDVSNSAVTGADGSFTIVGNGDVITMSYAGNNTYLATNTSIKFDNTASNVAQNTSIFAEDFSQYACDYYEGERGKNFTFRLVDEMGNPLANKTVYIGYNGITLNRTTDANGYAAVQINLQNAGLYTFAIVFLGDEDYNATMAVHAININKKTTSISASAKTFKATAKTKKYTVTLKTIKGASVDGKTYLKAGKKVTMKINGKTYTAKTNSKGQVTFSLKITKKGKFSAVINYGGSNTYEASSAKVKITIK